MTSKSSISFEGCLYTASWNAAYVQMLWSTSVLSRKLKRENVWTNNAVH